MLIFNMITISVWWHYTFHESFILVVLLLVYDVVILSLLFCAGVGFSAASEDVNKLSSSNSRVCLLCFNVSARLSLAFLL